MEEARKCGDSVEEEGNHEEEPKYYREEGRKTTADLARIWGLRREQSATELGSNPCRTG